jgi:hypothetical protein
MCSGAASQGCAIYSAIGTLFTVSTLEVTAVVVVVVVVTEYMYRICIYSTAYTTAIQIAVPFPRLGGVATLSHVNETGLFCV